MKRIRDDIKRNDLKHLYLLYGEEAYLRRQYRDLLKEAIVGEDEMNLSVYEGKDISIPALIDQAETLPFFAERRLVVIENSGLFKAGGEELAEYLKETPETTYFVLTEEEIDKRKSLYKVCNARGVVVEFARQEERTLAQWVASLLKKDGKRMTERDIAHFLALTGNDMTNIRNEVEKLVCYTGDREIVTGADADKVTTRQLSNHVFDMVEAMGNRQQERAMKLYYELLSLKEQPMGILRLIARQFRILLQTSELLGEHRNRYEIGERIKLSPYIAEKYMTQARKFPPERIRAALEASAKAEEDIKAGLLSDRLSVELLIVEFSS